MIWPKMRRGSQPTQRTATTNMRYTTQGVTYDGDPSPEHAIVAPAGHGVTIEIPPLGYLRISAEPTAEPAGELPIFDGTSDTMSLVEYAEHYAEHQSADGDAELSEADEIAALLGAAGIPCHTWQESATTHTVRYVVEVEAQS